MWTICLGCNTEICFDYLPCSNDCCSRGMLGKKEIEEAFVKVMQWESSGAKSVKFVLQKFKWWLDHRFEEPILKTLVTQYIYRTKYITSASFFSNCNWANLEKSSSSVVGEIFGFWLVGAFLFVWGFVWFLVFCLFFFLLTKSKFIL